MHETKIGSVLIISVYQLQFQTSHELSFLNKLTYTGCTYCIVNQEIGIETCIALWWHHIIRPPGKDQVTLKEGNMYDECTNQRPYTIKGIKSCELCIILLSRYFLDSNSFVKLISNVELYSRVLQIIQCPIG